MVTDLALVARRRRSVVLLGMLTILALGALAILWPRGGPATATGGNSITSPDTGGTVGAHTSLALDASGSPVVSYYDHTNGGLKVLHCNDPSCAGGDESITSPDTAGSAWYTSLALDSSGNPVVSYYAAGDLKVMHCNDPNCTGADESITSPDTRVGEVGRYASLALDSGGNPVVSYLASGGLTVLHCNDPNCTGGDESITSPDTAGKAGSYTSLALDSSGNPVVSYLDNTNFPDGDLKVLHCNDPNCAGGDESITSPDTAGYVGWWSSLALDSSGNPVVSYQDRTNWPNDNDLKVMHCNDPNCAGGDESITSPDASGDVGGYTSLALDSAGNPVVSYYGSAHLKVLNCDDPDCSGDESSNITTPDTAPGVGLFTSLALDSSGNPVVSYYDGANLDLKVLHCGDATCPGKPAPTPTPCGPEGCPTPTITPTPDPLAGPMSLNVKGGDCDDPGKPTECSVATGAQFTLSVSVNVVPAGGYIAIQTEIDYAGLSYKKTASAADEIVWPDSGNPLRSQPTGEPTVLNHASVTSVVLPFPKSNFAGNIVEIALNCTAAASAHTIELVAYSSSNTNGAGLKVDQFTEIPGSDSLVVNCVPPTPTPTPFDFNGTPVVVGGFETALIPTGSSNGNASGVAAFIAGGAAGAIALGGAAWYARRRRGR